MTGGRVRPNGAMGNGSLRDVLISQGHTRESSKNSPKNTRSGMPWMSLSSVSAAPMMTSRGGQFFPVKLAMSAGLVKLLLGALMVILGILAIMVDAALSSLGGGLWVGAVVAVSGFLGVCAARRPHVWVYVLGFMSLGGISMAASGVLVVLTVTAWARDTRQGATLLVHQVSYIHLVIYLILQQLIIIVFQYFV